MAGSNTDIHNRHYRDDQGDHSDKDGRNKTGWPRHYRAGLNDHENGSEGDSYMVAESEKSDGMERGRLPTDKYPIGTVKTKSWNHTRPMRRGHGVQTPCHGPSGDTLMSEPKGTSVIA